jgi:hypothetical protein
MISSKTTLKTKDERKQIKFTKLKQTILVS